MKRKNSFKQFDCDALIFGASGYSCTLWGRILSSASLRAGVVAEKADQTAIYSNHAVTRTGQIDFDFSSAICGFVDPFNQYEEFVSLADNKNIKFLFFSPIEFPWLAKEAPKDNLLSFLTMFLFRRFCIEGDGFTVFSRQSFAIKDKICALALERNLGYDFISWLNMNVLFCPYITFFAASKRACEEKLEIFTIKEKTPVEFLSLSQIIPQRTLKKEQALEDLFTATVYSCAAYARLHEIESMHAFLTHEKSKKFVLALVQEELSPFVDVSFEDKQVFILQMLSHLENANFPIRFTRLPLLAKIFGQTAASKICAHYMQTGIAPRHLTVALFCILEAYKVFEIKDETSSFLTENTLPKILKNKKLWHCDLSFLSNDLRDFESKVK